MRRTESKQWKWQRATIFTALLVGAVASILAMASACNGTDAYLMDDCPDAGASDGGDAGKDGGGGLEVPFCE